MQPKCFDGYCNDYLHQHPAGLKSHAVTLYEAGKLGSSCIAELCSDLASLEGKKFEGVLEEFASHAFSLRCFLECLQSGGVSANEITDNAGEAKTPRSSGHGIENAADHLAKVNVEGISDNNHNELSEHDHCAGDLDNSDGLMGIYYHQLWLYRKVQKAW